MGFWDKFKRYWPIFGVAVGVAGIVGSLITGSMTMIGKFIIVLVISLVLFARGRRAKAG